MHTQDQFMNEKEIREGVCDDIACLLEDEIESIEDFIDASKMYEYLNEKQLAEKLKGMAKDKIEDYKDLMAIFINSLSPEEQHYFTKGNLSSLYHKKVDKLEELKNKLMSK